MSHGVWSLFSLFLQEKRPDDIKNTAQRFFPEHKSILHVFFSSSDVTVCSMPYASMVIFTH